MRYSKSDIEDQLIATLKAAFTVNGKETVRVSTHAGEISVRMLMDPSLLEGLIPQAPFVYVQYQGRVKVSEDTRKQDLTFQLRWRFFVGAQQLADVQGGQRAAYAMLDTIYDAIQGHFPLAATPLTYPSAPTLSGVAITTAEFNPQKPFDVVDGNSEQLVLVYKGIVVYQTDYEVVLRA